MHVDESQSLAQLTGVDWGPAPEGTGSVVRERHEFRRTPLKNLSVEGLKRMLSLNFQDDHEPLIPYCLHKLDTGTENYTWTLQPCELLLEVLQNERYDWLQKPHLVHKARELVKRATYALYLASDEAEQTNDSLEYYRALLPNTKMDASLYAALASFEQRLSRVDLDDAATGGMNDPGECPTPC